MRSGANRPLPASLFFFSSLSSPFPSAEGMRWRQWSLQAQSRGLCRGLPLLLAAGLEAAELCQLSTAPLPSLPRGRGEGSGLPKTTLLRGAVKRVRQAPREALNMGGHRPSCTA